MGLEQASRREQEVYNSLAKKKKKKTITNMQLLLLLLLLLLSHSSSSSWTETLFADAHFFAATGNHRLDSRQQQQQDGTSTAKSSSTKWTNYRQRRRGLPPPLAAFDNNDNRPTTSNGNNPKHHHHQHQHVLLAAATKSIRRDARGGAAVAGHHIVKTMTARRMETFKFLSGGVAGTVAACITNPLEVIKTQLQSSNRELQKGHPVAVAKTIIQQDGPAGFFRGLPPTLVGIIPSRSAYFYAYARIKSFLDPTLPEGSPPNALIAGFLAGMVGNTLTNPIWMVRTRMQLLIDRTAGQRQYTGYGDAITTIWKEEGLGGFYKGITASYWGCAEGALQFIIYEQLKIKLIDRQNERRAQQGLRPTQELPKATYFWAAAASKAVAAVATYPHEVARTRMREQARAGIFKYQGGMWQTLRLMAQEEGVASLYSGMGVHLMKVVPNSALMFLTYEVVRGYLDQYQVVEP